MSLSRRRGSAPAPKVDVVVVDLRAERLRLRMPEPSEEDGENKDDGGVATSGGTRSGGTLSRDGLLTVVQEARNKGSLVRQKSLSRLRAEITREKSGESSDEAAKAKSGALWNLAKRSFMSNEFLMFKMAKALTATEAGDSTKRAFATNDVLSVIKRHGYKRILAPDDAKEIWDLRWPLSQQPDVIPMLVRCVQWRDPVMVAELYTLLRWAKQPTPHEALELLSFVDPKVRALGVRSLEPMSDRELSIYMLQLIRSVKFEVNIDTALVRFLLRRSIMNVHVVGQALFWHLQAEMDNEAMAFRFYLILKEFQRHISVHSVDFAKQIFVTNNFKHVQQTLTEAEAESKTKMTSAEKKQILVTQLAQTPLPGRFWCPLDPNVRELN